ncbi:hypothetical protein RZS08_00995, partial [Arthrospira platensis SPKY1]|nr:hypothetical protein [Arthrospira platensis SPKY1]
TRGARGGVRLAHPPGEVRLAALLSGENAQPPSTPVVQWLAARLSAARREALNGVTLAQLVQIERLQSAGLDFEI